MKVIMTFDMPKGFEKHRKIIVETIVHYISAVFGFDVQAEIKRVKEK
jgi:hypothetical protein